jgi:hypothetical protein
MIETPLVHALISRVYASRGQTADAISELGQALGLDQDGTPTPPTGANDENSEKEIH